MTTIQSEKGILNTSPATVYSELKDLNNLKKYLPEDKVSNWESDSKTCSFKVMGTYTIGLEVDEDSNENLIKYKATEKSPFPFTLNIHLNENDPENTEAQIICDAKLNAMLKMMVAKPLKNLFDYIIKQASRHFS